jgi:signal transduction histidine kinase
LEWRARLLICSHRNDSHSPLWIKGNETALKLALFNLVENAMKYSTDSVVIDMTVNVNRNQLIWQIKNQGPAIVERQIEQIFEPGYRAGNSGGQTGMGLGLYLARVIIQRHGGSLNYHLGAPQGSCFECCLALHHSPSTKQSKMTEED